MRISDEDTLKSLNDFRQRVYGLPPLDFEQWSHAREDSGDHKDVAREFIQSSLPAKPAAV